MPFAGTFHVDEDNGTHFDPFHSLTIHPWGAILHTLSCARYKISVSTTSVSQHVSRNYNLFFCERAGSLRAVYSCASCPDRREFFSRNCNFILRGQRTAQDFYIPPRRYSPRLSSVYKSTHVQRSPSIVCACIRLSHQDHHHQIPRRLIHWRQLPPKIFIPSDT
jgi:hypothetical protein